MQLKKSSLVLIALATVLMTMTSPSLVSAQISGINIGADPAGPTDNPSTGGAATATTAPALPSPSPTTVPTVPPATSVEPPPPPPATSTTEAPVPPPATSSNPGPGRRTTTQVAFTGTGTGTATTGTGTASPSPTKDSDGSSSGGSLATAGIVVGSVVVAAAIGIWVFRKWKLSPSREFQSKINGDDYTDYPRSYESDAVFLRNLGDQPAEPAPTKSPYHAAGGLPAAPEEQYYDASYDQHQTAGAYHNEGYGYDHGGYDHQAGGGYDYQTGYDQLGYDNGAYAHADYAQSQVSGGSQVGGHGGSQVGGHGGSQVGGYAQSNVGGGYQHQGYDDYGRR